jgi:mono/diheme cytochrome c family protein
MRFRSVAAASLLAAALSGCASTAPPADPVDAPRASEAPGVTAQVPAAPAHGDGEQVFRDVCSQCHTLEPPYNLAPPMRMVSGHLRQAFATEDEAVRHVIEYLRMPQAERSIMPPHAIERFGLMPPQPLPEAMLTAVARYVWSLSAEAAQGARPMRHRQRGGHGG